MNTIETLIPAVLKEIQAGVREAERQGCACCQTVEVSFQCALPLGAQISFTVEVPPARELTHAASHPGDKAAR